jgi:hypothetical protein
MKLIGEGFTKEVKNRVNTAVIVTDYKRCYVINDQRDKITIKK